MNNRINQPWVPLSRIQEFVQLEPALLLAGLLAVAWGIYQFLLRDISEDRHQNLQRLFRNVAIYFVPGTALFLIYTAIEYVGAETLAMERIQSYAGLLVLILGATVFIKLAKILIFEYLFLGHMKVAFPLLLVNLFTLIFSIIVAGVIATEIFSIRITSVLATSAIFSLVLGLALQDTLGNLFAGVALQFDKPYEIGDWIEVTNGSLKWIGQVKEISWRATVLTALTDESITVPNRVMAQAEIANYSTNHRSIIRVQLFRIPYGHSPETVKTLLLDALKKVSGVLQTPAPLVILTEATESWMTFKVLYSIQDYGQQLTIGDRVLSTGLKTLADAQIEIASPRMIATLRHAIPLQDPK